MHIAQVISHYVPAYRFGGPQHVAHGLGRALVQAGHRVSVFTTNLADERRNLDVPLDTPVDVDGVQVYYEPTQGSRYWGFSWPLYRRLQQSLAEADLVLVHFHYQFANYAGASIARRSHRPYYLFAHGSFKLDAISRKGRMRKKMYLNILERNNVRHAARIIFNAPEEQRASIHFPQACVLPNGLEPGDYLPELAAGMWRAKNPQANGKIVILFLGRIDFHGKGLDLLLPAIARLRREGLAIHLVLAGPDERGGAAATRRLIEDLSLTNDVTFLGMVTGIDKLQVLRDADCMVLPSRSEGLSIALLEALYLGIPILVTNQVGMHGKVAELRAGVVTEVSSPSIEAGLRLLLNNTQRATMRGAATHWIQQHHTWTAVAQQLLAWPQSGATD